MAFLELKQVSFRYFGAEEYALSDLSLTVDKGEWILLGGPSGGGKSTVLQLFCPALSPKGTLTGEIWLDGAPLSSLSDRAGVQKIGYLMQSPENQLVTDKVWHEMAFGLENMGVPSKQIRLKVAELAAFFGMEDWFDRDVNRLSGGQKQMVALASILALQPQVLLLDEPFSQLDPMGTQQLLGMLEIARREFGITVIEAEQRISEAVDRCSRMVFLERGKVIAQGTPEQMGRQLLAQGDDAAALLPPAQRIAWILGERHTLPTTIEEGRCWLKAYAESHPPVAIGRDMPLPGNEALRLEDVFFRYEKEGPDVVQNLSMKLYEGEIFALLGGNGAGKSTVLRLLSGALIAQRGRVVRHGQAAYLPQEVTLLFDQDTVWKELYHAALGENRQEEAGAMASFCGLDEMLDRHPYDLSGGQQQRLALGKVLLSQAKILLLDEPTKGMDALAQQQWGEMLEKLAAEGYAILLVSHDADFCAQYAHRCGLLFRGELMLVERPGAFFSGQVFFTTTCNKLTRGILPEAVTEQDVLAAFGAKPLPSAPRPPQKKRPLPQELPKPKKGKAVLALGLGITFLALGRSFGGWYWGLAGAAALFFALYWCVPPHKERMEIGKAVLGNQWVLISLGLLGMTFALGWGRLSGGGLSLLAVAEILAPFLLSIERQHLSARLLTVLAVLTAFTAAGRLVFFFLPQFKPTAAMSMLVGAALGPSAGFLVGSLSMLISNFYFGQSPMTPFQMAAMGLVGFAGGAVGRLPIFRRYPALMAGPGGALTVALYGGIVNGAVVFFSNQTPTVEMALTVYLAGLPLDLVHGFATAVFLYFGAGPVLRKLTRIRHIYALDKKRMKK